MVERTGGRLPEEKIEMKQLIFISEFREGEKCSGRHRKGEVGSSRWRNHGQSTTMGQHFDERGVLWAASPFLAHYPRSHPVLVGSWSLLMMDEE
jgi:hypothetical protein